MRAFINSHSTRSNMGSRASMRLRLTGAAFLMALAVGCGGGGGGGSGPLPELPNPPVEPPAPRIPALSWGAFPAASVVIGQPDFDSGDQPADFFDLSSLHSPLGNPGATANGTLFVTTPVGLRAYPDYAAAPIGPSAQFNIVLNARGVSVQGTRLVYVAGNEVRIFNSVPTNDQSEMDVRVGGAADCEADRFRGPQAAYITPQGRLVVADTDNHRVLIWKSVPESGEAADFVVGQRDMTACSINSGGAANGQTLRSPTSVWSDDVTLVVVDSGNHRVLVFDFPTGQFAAATHVIGQANPTDVLANAGQGAASNATLSSPQGVDVRGAGQIAVADSGNNRVLVWDTLPDQDGQAAQQVIGQEDFSGSAENADRDGPSASTLRLPVGVRFHDRNLLVVDRNNHRVLVFRSNN